MKMIVGLGNPGKQYAGTRHNVGFDCIEVLSARASAGAPASRFKAEVAKGFLGREDVLLVCPQTYMNLSGTAVGQVARYHKIELADIVVIHDDVDIPVARVKVKEGGGAGGNKGLLSIFEHMGKDFVRIRIGVGRPPPGVDTADWVLSRFHGSERGDMGAAIDRAADAVECLLAEGAKIAMNKFNGAGED